MLLLACVACSPTPDATIVALRGCGLGEGLADRIRVTPRGDFPPSDENEETVRDDVKTLRALPDGASGFTVEGLFGTSQLVVAVGRTARLVDEGEMPVYFAPEDQLCAVASGVTPRDVGAIAVGERGDVLIVGGRTPQGLLLDDIVHYLDVDGVATPLTEHLPLPSDGQTLHPIAGRRFVVVGGAGSNRAAFDSVVVIELVDPPQDVVVSPPRKIDVPGQADPGRAHHGGASLPDGAVLIVGGCSQSDDGACVPNQESVLRSSFVIIPPRDEGGAMIYQRGPELLEARYDHDLLIGRDGVAFAVGGLGVDGQPINEIERFVPGSAGWLPYGPELTGRIPENTSVVGASLIEGGLVVVALSDGGMWWVTQTQTGPMTRWCDGTETEPAECFDGFIEDPPLHIRRPLLTLPGERVIGDAWLLPVALFDRTGDVAKDLSVALPGQTSPPPGQRRGAAMVQLADGTVLFAGGRDPFTGEVTQPFFLRLRPVLDGPDEIAPDIQGPAPGGGSLVLHDPTRITRLAATGFLEFLTEGELLGVPSVWAHVRGFRSASFGVELTVVATGSARPHLVFSGGAAKVTTIRFDPEGTRWIESTGTGVGLEISCESVPLDFTVGQPLRADVSPNGITIRSGLGGLIVAQCPAPTTEIPLAVGFGASGNGTVEVSSLRLDRQ